MKLSEQEQYDEWKDMPLSEKMRSEIAMASCYAGDVKALEKQLASARSIMEKFVFKVDTGRARSTETYAEMTEWLKAD